MPAVDSNEDAEGRDGLWSGPARSPGSALLPAYALAFVALAGPAVIVLGLLFAVLPILTWWLGVIVGLGIAAVVVWLRAGRADHLALGALGAVVPESDRPARLTNMIDGLTLAGGVIAPAVTVIDDSARNAMAVRRGDRNHLVFTSGLVEALEVVELEGAVAELLTRLRNGDAETATVGAALLGRPFLDGPLGPALGPVARRVLQRMLPDDRDLEADRQAVTLTRYPPGLIKALEAMEGHDLRPRALSEGTAHLWLADPEPASSSDGPDHRSPLSLRIDALAEL